MQKGSSSWNFCFSKSFCIILAYVSRSARADPSEAMCVMGVIPRKEEDGRRPRRNSGQCPIRVGADYFHSASKSDCDVGGANTERRGRRDAEEETLLPFRKASLLSLPCFFLFFFFFARLHLRYHRRKKSTGCIPLRIPLHIPPHSTRRDLLLTTSLPNTDR
jgi:hypothetical protein